MTIRRLTSIPAILWICAAFVVLGAVYAWATPPLEASDEREHMGMVQAIAETGRLPAQRPGAAADTWWAQEGSQPPLYYALAAALVAPINRDDFETARLANPHALIGIPGALGNKNRLLNAAPSGGTARAVYVLRGFGVTLGAATVATVYYAAGLISAGDNRAALLAAALTAFNPMFIFISASVNNDNLVTALNSAIIYLTLRAMRDGFDTRRSLLIAVLAALAALSKLSALALLPAVGLAALWTAYRRRDWRGLLVLCGLIAALWALLAGWWYVRNLDLYGELFGTDTMVAVAGERPGPFTLRTLIHEFEGFRMAYWGVFGAVNILTVGPFYRIMDAVTLLGAAGLVWHVWRRRDSEGLAQIGALVAVILTGMAAVIGWTAQTYASQGRLLFPFVAASGPLLALGLSTVLDGLGVRLKEAALKAGPAVLGLFACVVPFVTIAPQYRPPPPLSSLPAGAVPVYARFSMVELVGYETPDRRYEPGDSIPVTVYWRALERTDRDYSLYLHVITADGAEIGKIDSYPGGGLLRTTAWTPGAIYADRYAIPLDGDAAGRYGLRVQVGWWDYAAGELVQAVDENGQPLASVMLNAGGFAGPEALPDPAVRVSAVEFGGVIRLAGYTLDGDTLTLIWQALETPGDNYTVFVQVMDEAGALAGQGDAPPALPTRYWSRGERYVTRHTIHYPQPPPAGAYRLLVGWYSPTGFFRLDTDSPDDAYLLAVFSR